MRGDPTTGPCLDHRRIKPFQLSGVAPRDASLPLADVPGKLSTVSAVASEESAPAELRGSVGAFLVQRTDAMSKLKQYFSLSGEIFLE